MKRYPIKEKKHRLPPEAYIGEMYVAFTICVKNYKTLFTDNLIFLQFEEILLKTANDFECELQVYLFMPDHLHLIISGKNSKSNIKKCVDMFKQKTGFWLYKNRNSIRWQKDYYDHILRNKENLIIQIRYILDNPVRANLVDDWKDYHFKGSTVFNLDEWEDLYF